MTTVELENGWTLACQTRTEARFFYRDIFEERVYLRHGIELFSGATVLDVGGNIGLFSLFVASQYPGSRVFSFEPCPPLYAIARQNLERYAPGARIFPFGIAERERRALFTFYPNSSGMSSLYADESEEREVLRVLFRRQREEGMAGMDALLRHEEDLLDERLRTEVHQVELKPLSAVIRELDLDSVDLLKIDVQKAEAEVLAGIDEQDWPKLGQIVLEVHDLEGRLAEVTRLLKARGFTVAVEQEALYTGSNTFNLYARRRQMGAGSELETGERARRQRLALTRVHSLGKRRNSG